MLRTVGDQPSLFESVLPAELLRLPAELARIDELLDDPAFFEPFVPFFDPRLGRPSTPMETYLRLMFLKFRYGFGFESLCRGVSDSITWRRFCRIPLEAKMPHPTTLMKLTTRCGSAAVAGLNEALLAKASEAKVLRTTKLRVDTTVVPAIDHNLEAGNPADGPQLAPAVERVARRAGRAPRKVTADRGYGEKKIEDDLHDLGVKDVVIPRKGKPSATRRADEHRPAFRRTIKWRTGVEGRISTLKRGYGWDRTRIDGTEGARTWVGYGVLAHNLVKISNLAAA